MILPASLGHTEVAGSLDALSGLLNRLRDDQSTGILQAGMGSARLIVFVHARGILAGTYAVENGVSRPILQADLDSFWEGKGALLQQIPSPAKFARMSWLALESSLQSRSNVQNEAEWNQQLAEWKRVHFSGLVEIVSKDNAGYLWMEGGRILAPEATFIGNASSVAHPAEVATYVPNPETNAHQCLVLRLLALKWANGILGRFQQVAGQKFAQVVGREVMAQIQPWGWEMHLENGLLCDDHFFPRVAAATHAYRAIFMGLGAQMGFALGATLTQRILSEMFYELDGEERAVLSSHRLIPAAFSE